MLNRSDDVFLSADVQVEPLIDRWYAWTHLIPPATAARNITERHLKIMESYIAAPQIHANAVKTPKLLGGPFIDYKSERVQEIRALRESTIEKRAVLIELSRAITELDELLRLEAKGSSLSPVYAKVPPKLKGLVELGYDLNNSPSFRLVESLLYRSTFYDRSMQSLMVAQTKGDDRPFILSTPRLDDNDSVNLNVPFDDPFIDKLFTAKFKPLAYRDLGSMLAEREIEPSALDRFLSHTGPTESPRYEGPSVRWRYFGHACILVETRQFNILFDPVLSYTYESAISRYTYADLPPQLDYVVITHNHQDHVLFETLLQLRHKIECIVVPRNSYGTLQDPSLKLLLNACGFQRVVEMNEFGEIELPGGSLTGLPFFGEHSDLHIGTKLSYLVRIGNNSLLFAADSCNIEPLLYHHLRPLIGAVDVLFLGMECDGAPLTWLYGPLLTKRLERKMDESRRLAGCNFEQAADMVNSLGCREVYVYAMGQEPWLNFIMSLKYTEESRPIKESNRLIEECSFRNIRAARLFGEKEILMT